MTELEARKFFCIGAHSITSQLLRETEGMDKQEIQNLIQKLVEEFSLKLLLLKSESSTIH